MHSPEGEPEMEIRDETDQNSQAEEERIMSSSTASDDDLEEEDLELLQENLDVARKRDGFRRLERLLQEKEQVQADEEEEEEEEGISFIRRNRKRVAPEELERLFEEDDKAAAQGTTNKYDYATEERSFEESEDEDEDDLKDFIEEDLEEEQQLQDQTRSKPKSTQKTTATKAYLTEAFGGRLPSRVIRDLMEVFGDGTDYFDMIQEGPRPSRRDKVPPTETITSERELVCTTDIPERIQLRDGRDRRVLDADEFDREATWIAKRWMQDRTLADKFASVDLDRLVTVIASVLTMFREHKLEVPMVATHRKEYFQHLLGLYDLWNIWDYDEQWKVLKKQQNNLLTQVEEKREEDKMLLREMVKSAETISLLDLVGDYLRQSKKDSTGLSKNVQEALKGMIGQFSLTLNEFKGNLHERAILHHPPNPPQDPLALATIHCQGTGLTPEHFLNAVILHLAHHSIAHPSLHMILRAMLEQGALLTVTPTMRGKQEIDSQHELASIKYLTAKPLSALQEDQFLLVLKGHHLGLLTYQIILPREEEILNHLGRLFGGLLPSPSKEEREKTSTNRWEEVRWRALVRALEQHVLPRLRRELIARLQTDAERWVATCCQYVLQDKLMVRPYEPPIPYQQSPRVMVISWGAGGSEAVTMAVVLDQQGRVLDQARLPHLHEKHSASNSEQWNRLWSLVNLLRPSCILVSGWTLSTRDLYASLQGKIANGLSGSTNGASPAILYAEDDVARIYRDSSRARAEWPDYSPLLRYCISVGRRWLNPLFEFAALSDSELFSLNLHPLQGMVSSETHLGKLHRAFINVVNLVGLDINLALSCAWARSPLRFICGLGPFKADWLIRAISRQAPNNGRLGQRKDLLTLDNFGPIVYANCASFLRIKGEMGRGKRSGGETIMHSSLTGSGGDPLDDTRIHPENYALARKMAADALEISLEDLDEDGEAADRAAQHAVAKIMDQPARLDDLLLEEYAKELVKRGQPSKHLTLLDIKAELQRPYAELQSPSNGPGAETLFEMLTGETERTLWVGANVRATVDRLADRLAICHLDSGVMATLVERTGERHRVGQTVMATVTAIDVGKMSVELAERRSPASVSAPGEDMGQPRFGFDPYYDHERAQADSIPKRHSDRLEGIHEQRNSGSTINRIPLHPPRRHMTHPAFREVSRAQAEELLRTAVLGEVIIRPSGSRGPDHLSLTWKIDDDNGRVALYQHLDIVERDRPASTIRMLMVDGEPFEDLDEIIARHVEPIAAYLRDVRATPKYLPLTARDRLEARRQIEDNLAQQRRRDPSRIAYILTLSRDRPGNILLSFQPNSKAYHEAINVCPAGFIMRGQHFERIEDLIVWFKQHYRDSLYVSSGKPLGRPNEQEFSRHRPPPPHARQ